MNDPEGVSELAALITKPRVITPSLTYRRPAAEREVEVPTLVEPTPRDVPTSRRTKVPTTRSADHTTTVRGEVRTTGSGDRPSFAARKLQVQLRVEQEAWLHGILADAIREGVRVSEADVVRVAMDRLCEGAAGWSDLREAILAETKARAKRR